MRRASRTQAAELDLQEIAFQIAVADGRPAASERLIDEIVGQCDRLAELSETATLGTAATELGEDIRLFTIRRWVLIFRYTPQGVDILRVADGSQDFLSWKLS